MSKHKTIIKGQTQYVYRCEKCGYEADSIDSPTLAFEPPVCPRCKVQIGREPGEPLPDNTRGRGY
jgi:rubrerythrin